MKIIDWTLHAPDRNFHVFVELHTDAGISGWGSAYSERNQVLGAFQWLKRFVVGENPLEIERVTERLHQITFWLGRGGAMTHAISAINLALWDVTGKALQQPVHVLLGGRLRTTVPVYGSALFRPVETLPARIEQMRARGFRAIKLGWDPFFRQSLAEDERLMQLARRAAGDEITLMIDAGGSDPFWPRRLKDARERARMLHAYQVAWFEEPLAPDDLEGYASLRQESPVKIAHGEVLTRRQTFFQYFSRGAMDIAQPDATKVGGLSEMRRIAWLAEEHGVEIVPHGWNTCVGVAADLHFVSTLPTQAYVEYNVGNPLIEDVALERFSLNSDGTLTVPDAPGLSVEVDRDRLRELSQRGFASGSWAWDNEPP